MRKVSAGHRTSHRARTERRRSPGFTNTLPMTGILPAAAESKVDFPAPFGPTTPMRSPGTRRQSTPVIKSRSPRAIVTSFIKSIAPPVSPYVGFTSAFAICLTSPARSSTTVPLDILIW
eukprot:3873685-Rhodomonas_salina.1